MHRAACFVEFYQSSATRNIVLIAIRSLMLQWAGWDNDTFWHSGGGHPVPLRRA